MRKLHQRTMPDTLQEPELLNKRRFRGLEDHMRGVLAAQRQASEKLTEKAIHRLRVSLRACGSVADCMRELDDHPAWRLMRKRARSLFKSVGALRDVHVLEGRVKQLSAVRDSVSRRLLRTLAQNQLEAEKLARRALEQFDRKLWRRWLDILPKRSARIVLGDPAFEQLALQRWTEAETSHYAALEKRSRDAYHDLRIAIKRFRYTVASFLPQRAQEWGRDLRRVQNILGEVHDLDLVDQIVKRHRAIRPGAKKRWRQHIEREIQARLTRYRKLSLGEQSLWSIWRAGLPGDTHLHESAVARLAAWAQYRDPEPGHTAHVARLSLQLFDALRAARLREPFNDDKARHDLEAATFLHNIGANPAKGRHKRAARLIRELAAPIGWSRFEMDTIADIVRYHRGAEPQTSHRRFAARPPEQQQAIARLAGVLRLAVALDAARDQSVKGLALEVSPEAIMVRAEGFNEHSENATAVETAKTLLETSLDRLVLVKAVDYIAQPVLAAAEEEE